MNITTTKNLTQPIASQPIRRAAVIDYFGLAKKNVFDIDGDGVTDKVSHGAIVSLILRARAKDYAEITDFDASERCYPELPRILKEIKKNNIQGSTIHAVNMSLGSTINYFSAITIKVLQELTGLELNSENLFENRKKIIDFFKTSSDRGFNELYNIIKAIEEVIASGSTFFMCGGNAGHETVNLFGLAEGVTNVGATNAQGEIAPYSSQHSLINIYRQGIHSVTEVFEGNELTGYSIINDGTVEIPLEKVSGGTALIRRVQPEAVNFKENQECFPLSEGVLYPAKRLLKEINRRLKEIDKLLNSVNKYSFNGYTIWLEKKVLLEIKDALENSFGGKFVALLNLDPEIILSEIKRNWLRFFDVDDKGKIIYDPDRSGRKAINFISGCSFATPIATSEYLASLCNVKVASLL
ncbi:MAG: hypothetical protein HY094_02570 [Candidatus Melainabacteria bacterium]|nr:hypothetical protein [Candidatus Melainabacteria bacterium]